MSAQDAATSAIITTASHGVDTSLFGMLTSSDLVTKFIVLILLMASVWTWVIIIQKYIMCNAIKKNIRAFEKLFWSGQVLDTMHDRLKKTYNDPLTSIFIEGMNEYKSSKTIASTGNDSALKISIRERLMKAMSLECSKESEKLESKTVFLAMIGSTATFVGLFGTVWGIIHSFQSIAASQNTTLAVVAPGIAEALLLTGIGLFAAIPAAASYSIIANQVSLIVTRMDDFVLELYNILSRAMDEGRS